MKVKEGIQLFRIDPDEDFHLRDHDPGWAGTKEMRELGEDELKDRAKQILQNRLAELADAQEVLYANDIYSVLLIFQAMDAAGKDGTIKHVMSGVNPQGCQVFSFKKPSDEELDHDFLWRYQRNLPERGRIGIFNRSYYEDVLVVKVHPELLERQKLPAGEKGDRFWKHRYQSINDFERHLARNGTLILKFFLNVSKDEQKKRFLERLTNPEKHWKFSEADVAEREHWDDYQSAFEDAIRETTTGSVPWYVIPADHKWVTRTLVAIIIAEKVRELGLAHPVLTEEQSARLADARKRLEGE